MHVHMYVVHTYISMYVQPKCLLSRKNVMNDVISTPAY